MKSSINLTIIFIAVAMVSVAGIAGGVMLTFVDKDATAFYGFFTTVLVAVIGFGGSFYVQSKANTKLDNVETKVNGNLSKLIDLALSKATTRTEVAEVREIATRVDINPTGEIRTVNAEGGS